jgi:hypothetical protein
MIHTFAAGEASYAQMTHALECAGVCAQGNSKQI